MALRLALLTREERIADGVRRWVRRAKETFSRSEAWTAAQATGAFEKVVQDARGLLGMIDGNVDCGVDDASTHADDTADVSTGSLARLVAAQSAVTMLVEELQTEMEKRTSLERAGVIENDVYEIFPSPALEGTDETKNSIEVSSRNYDAARLGRFEEPNAARLSKDLSKKLETPADAEPAHDTPPASACPPSALPSVQPPTIPPASPAEALAVARSGSPAQAESAKPSEPFEERSPPLQTTSTSMSTRHHSSLHLSQNLTPLIDSPNNHASSLDVLASSSIPSTSHTSPTSHTSHGSHTHALLDESNNLDQDHIIQSPSGMKHPLLSELTQAAHRYDDLQRAFRDCHFALQDLKKTLPVASDLNSSLIDPAAVALSLRASPEILRAALERLYDYTEDTRVELEIRAADEALLSRGFQALLSVPNSLSPSFPSTPSNGSSNTNGEHPDQQQIEHDIQAFIDGTEPSVKRAWSTFTTKLEDIQHDIAAIKRAAHESVLTETTTGSLEAEGTGTWTSWTAGIIRAGSRPASPALTTGNPMTLRLHRPLPSDDTTDGLEVGDPFTGIGLRIPMPTYVPSSLRMNPRVRTTSMLGLGLRPHHPTPGGLFASARAMTTPATPELGLPHVGENENMDIE